MSQEMIQDAEFDTRIKGMEDRALAEFTAREIYYQRRICQEHSAKLADHGTRIKAVEHISKRSHGLVGMFGAFLGSAIMGAIDWLVNRGGN